MLVPEPGTTVWVARLLESEWGLDPSGTLQPLGSEGGRPLTHTAGLWRCRADGRDLVLKVQLTPQAARPAAFYPLKHDIVAHCRRAGVPAAEALPTRSGAPTALRDGVVCELVPHYPGTALHHAHAQDVRAAVRAALDLRQALDALPARAAKELADLPVNPLVDQEDPRLALAEAADLLRLAESRSDPWSSLAAAALREVLETASLLDAVEPDRPEDAIVHGDLHRHHFLLGPRGVEAILDFDNTRTGDRLLDLAWTFELCLSAPTPGDPAGPELLRELSRDCRGRGLLDAEEERLLMPLLVSAAVPVIVDIAKDILVRDILSPVWAQYFELLSPLRRARVHALLRSG